MRRATARLRDTWAALLHTELDGTRREITTSIDELRTDVVRDRDAFEVRAAGRDGELVTALHRIADSFERVADGLEAERADRIAQGDAIEFLLRELVLGAAVAPTAIRPTVLGGSIDRSAAHATDGAARAGVRSTDVDIDLGDPPLPVDALVEVRSRFHDHWVHGFAVAEYLPGPRRRGYRLRRITDTDRLPLLFDAADVRRAIPPPRQPVPESLEEPDPSMWR
jgi:hypothetical protein